MGGVRTVGLLLGLCACGDDLKPGDELVDGRFSRSEWERIRTLGPLEALPENPTNRYADNEAVASFGHRLFFETRWAGPLLVADDGTNGGLGQLGEKDKVACITCHDPEGYYNDTRPNNKLSVGAAVTGRNAPSLVNVAFYQWGNWAGAHDQMWKQGANGVESKDNFNGNRLDFAHVLYEHYREDYDAIFPTPLDPALDPAHAEAARFPLDGKPKASGAADGPWEMMTDDDRFIINTIMANVGKAYEAYERKLISDDSPFDHYVQGNYTAISESAKRGLAIFTGKAACIECHSGTTFTDQQFHNTGIAQTRDPQDQGRYDDLPRALNNTFSGAGMFSDDPVAGAAKLEGQMQADELRGKFRTKSLRHLTETAPYFHDGSMATLRDVVEFYNQGGHATGFPGVKDPRMIQLNLSDEEMKDLVAFLETLTGEPVPERWRLDPLR